MDHAGSAIPAASLIDAVSEDLKTNLYGNPHSENPSSSNSTLRIHKVRSQVLELFNASPEIYDVVFVANSTAAIKLVGEAFAGSSAEKGISFDFIGHTDAHSSLVSVRNFASSSTTFDTHEMEEWIANGSNDKSLRLVGYPGQSNFSGNRLPLGWTKRIRDSHTNTYVLLDAAAYVTSSPLSLENAEESPDFVALSFYKIFGLPDLGALILRREAAEQIIPKYRYQGGGTFDFIMNPRIHPTPANPNLLRKNGLPHTYLEDGTVPFHSITALGHAIEVQQRLFGTFENVSSHVSSLAHFTYEQLSSFVHYNGQKVAEIYTENSPRYTLKQGPTLTFNLKRSDGSYIGFNEVLKIAIVQNIHVRTGGLCNPGGTMRWAGFTEEEMRESWAAGKKCGDEWDLVNGKPLGGVRVSFAAMSTVSDAIKFIEFIKEFFVEELPGIERLAVAEDENIKAGFVEKITIFPIKSCGGYDIPLGVDWPIHPEGLEWDREFCLVDISSGRALSQKKYPKMTFIKPSLDAQDLFKISCLDPHNTIEPLLLTFEELDSLGESSMLGKSCESRVCGDNVSIWLYTESRITAWFTLALGIPCTLGRHANDMFSSTRNTNLPDTPPSPIKLSNESPILVINKYSVNELNRQISAFGGKPATSDIFRGNITVSNVTPNPYDEDKWKYVNIGNEVFQLLGPCQRCQMICIDQHTGEKNPDPFSMLSKTRKVGGKVMFGQHAKHLQTACHSKDRPARTIRVGDTVKICGEEEIVPLRNEKDSDTETLVEENYRPVGKTKRREAWNVWATDLSNDASVHSACVIS